MDFRLSFATIMVPLFICCTVAGFTASYYLNDLFFSIAEPYIYPCHATGKARPCTSFSEEGPSLYWTGLDLFNIRNQAKQSCIVDFLYDDPLPPGTLKGQEQ